MLRIEPLKLSTLAGNARERAYSGLRQPATDAA